VKTGRTDISETEDDALFQTERWFEIAASRSVAYRVPLPDGRFKVTLGFAEIFSKEPGRREFDVLLEDKTVLTQYEPLEQGFATAEKKVFEVAVKDGFLEIAFARGKGGPKLSAIQIVPVR
jgi:hypothetical protein